MIRIAFYIGNKYWWDKLISGYTWIFNIGTIPTSHVEIGFQSDGEWKYFSSCSRYLAEDNKRGNGTRWTTAEKLFTSPDRWRVYQVEPLLEEETMISHANKLCGERYDWLGILGFGTLFGILNDPDSWYCSEVCWCILTGKWLKRISPRRMFSRCCKIFKTLEVKKCDYV